MRKFCTILLFLLTFHISTSAQMWNGVDTLYGNEWIDFDQTYYRLSIAEDGIYRIDYQALAAQGIPVTEVSADQFKIFKNGKEIPVFKTTTNLLQNGDFLEFFGQKNRTELDQFLFINPSADLLNSEYSMYTDTTSYFLTWSSSTGSTYNAVNNNLNNLPAKEEWFWYEDLKVYTVRGVHKTNFDAVAESAYDLGEGFGTNYNVNNNITFNPSQVFPNGLNSTFEIRLVSTHGSTHELNVSLNNSTIFTDNWSGTQIRQIEHEKASSALSNEEKIMVSGSSAANDRYSIAYARLTYPRTFNLADFSYLKFQLSANNSAQYLELENFTSSSETPILYDLTNNLRIESTIEDNLVKIKLPPSTLDRELVLVKPEAIIELDQFPISNFVNFEEINSDYIILSNPKLYSDNNGENWVQAYADYRASNDGGNFTPLVVDVNQLYAQFSYGINRHPLAVRNFAHYINKNWPSPPRYFFIIGKGREYQEIRTAAQLSAAETASFAVPTFGRPGSDNLLLASNDSSVPLFPVGRLAVSDPNDIKLYFEKVKGFETLQEANIEDDRAWKKEIIHLGGGTTPSEQNSIKTQLAGMENIIENNAYGANVFTFTKSSSDPIQQSQSGLLTQKINDGVSIITFFGHSGTGGFDFSIDDPSSYENKDRYPAIFSLGCLSGQVHSNAKSIGERFLFQKEKGAIAFVATTGLGYISPLANMHKEFYRQIGGNLFGSGIGEILRTCLQTFSNRTSIPDKTLNQQYTLAGDPAIVLFPFEQADFLVDEASLRFEPEVINNQMDSFAIHFNIENIGRAVSDSLDIEISRAFPNGSKILVKRDRIASPKYSNNYTYWLPVNKEESVGNNRLFIKLDPFNQIAESPEISAENNNDLRNSIGEEGVAFYVFSNGVSTAYPPEFALVGEDSVILKATTADIFAEAQNYIFQLDTTALFNSPFLKEYQVNQKGGVLKWPLSANLLQDSMVYYWRVSPDSTAEFSYIWNESSFQYIANHPLSWNQSHYFQLQKDAFFNVRLEEETRSLKYLDDFKDIGIKLGVYPIIRPEISVNNTPYRYIPWDDPIRGGLLIAVLDSLSGNPWLNIPTGPGIDVGQYGSNIPSWVVDYALFPFSTREEEDRTLAMDFLENIVPSGNYVVIISAQESNFDYEPSEWAADSTAIGDRNLFNLLEAQGATKIRQTAVGGAAPYLFVYKKDDPSFEPIEDFGTNDDVYTTSVGISGTWDNGYVESVAVGPASKWLEGNWSIKEVNPTEDSIRIELWGTRQDSTTLKLKEYPNLATASFDISDIDAETFPYLKWRYYSRDTASRSVPQLDYWRITHEGIPDLALNPAAYYVQNKDTLQQGEQLFIDLAIENVGTASSSPTIMNSQLLNDLQFNIPAINIPEIEYGDTAIVHLKLETMALNEIQALQFNVNPDASPIEYSYLNNIGLTNFFVEKDKRNPIVNVTFDGVYIMNGDLVAPNPTIQIKIRDENPYLLMNDTSLFTLLLRYPNEPEHRRMPFDNSTLFFQGADNSDKNEAFLELNPNLDVDGTYELIVQAEDVSGNQSGNLDYKIQFEVIRKAMISNVFNYPNPFSTSTQFVYTLTGIEPPEDFVIQIMTVSGRMVRELTQNEIGPLKIGTHRTEYAWDGTDQYGDRLANGVYLYRVLARDRDGKQYEKYDTGTDQFFKNNIGKMVILR